MFTFLFWNLPICWSSSLHNKVLRFFFGMTSYKYDPIVTEDLGKFLIRPYLPPPLIFILNVTFLLLGYIRGVVYCTIWYGSICLGFFFLYAPVLPLMLFWPALFRKIIDIIQACWEAFNTVSNFYL